MTTTPLLYFWGDDELVAGRARRPVRRRRWPARPATPLERWDLRGETAATAGADSPQLHERIATPVDVRRRDARGRVQPGRARAHATRPRRVVEAIGLLAPGNALVILEATKSGAKGPSPKRLADADPPPAARIAGGRPRPRPRSRLDRARGARARPARSRPAPPSELAERLGGFVTGGRRRPAVPDAASRRCELDKLALLPRSTRADHVDDVRALVAEATAGLGLGVHRRGRRAASRAGAGGSSTGCSTHDPSPSSLAVLHRRVRELLELGDRLARGANARRRGPGDGHHQRVPGRDAGGSGARLDDRRARRARSTGSSSSMRW